MSRALNHFKSNVIAYLALFVALGGTSYAAATLGAGSVGTRQLKNHSVTPVKLQKGSIAGYVRDWAQVNRRRSRHRITASRPHRSTGRETGHVPWGRRQLGSCQSRAHAFPLATTSTARRRRLQVLPC